jgi:hypothetical protein
MPDPAFCGICGLLTSVRKFSSTPNAARRSARRWATSSRTNLPRSRGSQRRYLAQTVNWFPPGASLSTRRSAAIWTGRLLSSTASPVHAVSISVSFDTGTPRRSISTRNSPTAHGRARPARRDGKESPPRCRGEMGQRCNSATPVILTALRNLFELFHDRFRTPGRERSRLRSDNRDGHMRPLQAAKFGWNYINIAYGRCRMSTQDRWCRGISIYDYVLNSAVGDNETTNLSTARSLSALRLSAPAPVLYNANHHGGPLALRGHLRPPNRHRDGLGGDAVGHRRERRVTILWPRRAAMAGAR